MLGISMSIKGMVPEAALVWYGLLLSNIKL